MFNGQRCKMRVGHEGTGRLALRQHALQDRPVVVTRCKNDGLGLVEPFGNGKDCLRTRQRPREGARVCSNSDKRDDNGPTEPDRFRTGQKPLDTGLGFDVIRRRGVVCVQQQIGVKEYQR